MNKYNKRTKRKIGGKENGKEMEKCRKVKEGSDGRAGRTGPQTSVCFCFLINILEKARVLPHKTLIETKQVAGSCTRGGRWKEGSGRAGPDGGQADVGTLVPSAYCSLSLEESPPNWFWVLRAPATSGVREDNTEKTLCHT